MRKCLTLLVLALATAAPAIGQSNIQSGSPAIHFENTNRDVGTVTQGETITQVFKFANKGPGTLQILNVAHS